MTGTILTASQAEAEGSVVDRTCYPWFAYKGPRFAPDEIVEIITEAHVPGDGPSTDLRARCAELIDHWGDGASPDATGFAEQLQEALDTTTPTASEDFGGIPLLEKPLTVDEASALSAAQGEEGGYVTVLIGLDETEMWDGYDDFLDELMAKAVSRALLADINYEPHPATCVRNGIDFKVHAKVVPL